MSPTEGRPSTGSSTDDSVLPGVGRGVAWSLIALAFSRGGSLVVTAYGVRRLGTGPYGLYAVAAGYTALIQAIDLGLGLSVIREAARAHGHAEHDARRAAQDAVRAAHASFCLLGGIALGVTAVLAAVLPRQPNVGSELRGDYTLTIALLGVTTAVSLATTSLAGLTAGRRDFRTLALGAGVGTVVRIAALVLLAGPLGLPALGVVAVAGMLAERAVLQARLRHALPWWRLRPVRPSGRDLRALSAFALPVFALTVKDLVVSATDLQVLVLLAGASAAGLYSVGTKGPNQVTGALLTGYSVLFPSLAGSGDAQAQEDATRFVSRVSCYTAGVGFAVIAGSSGAVVQALLGRPSGLASGVLIAFCAVSIGNAVVNGLATLLIARGRHRRLAAFVPVELGVNAGLTVLLVHLMGPIGVAVATVATVWLYNFVAFPLLARREYSAPVLRLLLRDAAIPAFLGCVVGGVAAAVGSVAGGTIVRLGVASVVAGVLGFVAGALLLGGPGRDALRRAFHQHTLAEPAVVSESATLDM